MDLDKLNYFIVINEEKNFTKAAKKLFITQPALSQYISTVENELNTKLFDRSSHPIKLTTSGEIFIRNAKELLNIKSNMIREINNAGKNYIGTLKIGISPFRSPYMLPKVLSKIAKDYPRIKLLIFEKNSKEIEQMLETGELDLAILSLPLSSKNFSFTEFYNEETFIITPKNDFYLTISENGFISLEKLKNEMFILPNKKIKLREKIDFLFYNNNMAPNIFLEAETQESILSFIESGLGIGFASKMSLDYKNWKNDLLHFSIKEEKLFRRFVVAFKADRTLNEIENKFIDLLIESLSNKK